VKDKDTAIDYRTYIDNLLTFNGMLDMDGKLLMANRTIVERAGLSYDDVIGKYFPDIYWWSYDPQVQKRIANAIDRAKKGETIISEEKARLAGSYVDTQLSIRPVFDAKGKTEYLIAEGQDVTDIKATEKELRKSHALIHAISNFAGVADMKGTLTLINRNALKHTGFTEDEVIGLPFWECEWFKTSSENMDKIRGSIDTALQGKTTRVEVKVITKDGREIKVLHTSSPIRDSSGTITGIALEGMDISAIKEKENRLAKSETMYRDLVTHMNEGLALVDKRGYYSFVNPKYAEMIGYSEDKIIGIHINAFFDKKNRQIIKNEYKNRVKNMSSQYEITYTTGSGGKMHALVSASPILKNGVYNGSRIVITDLTQFQEKERSAAKIRSHVPQSGDAHERGARDFRCNGKLYLCEPQILRNA